MANTILIKGKATAGAFTVENLQAREIGVHLLDKYIAIRIGSAIVTFPDLEAIQDLLSNAGGGDMLKSVYDGNNDGVVDNASNAASLGGVSSSSYALKTYVDSSISALVAGSPELLNTLNEIAAALGDDPNFSSTIMTLLGQKLDANSTIDGGTVS